MFTRYAQVQNFDSQSSGDLPGDGATSEPQHDVGKMYNENRKLQRLLEKQSKEMEAMKAEFSPMKGQLSRFQSMFSGVKEEENAAPLSYLDKVRRADKSIRDADPSSNGLALTLEGAEMLEQIRAENAAMKQQLQKASSPQFIAEQQMFVNLEGHIKEQMEQFFGEDGVDDNYQDFERVAISKLKEIAQDKKRWTNLIRSPEMQRQFCKSVILAKMPKMDKMPGWQKIESYGVDDAKRDLMRSEQMADKARQSKSRDMMHQASELATKARQRLLPETLGLRFRDE